MNQKIEALVEDYEAGTLDRRQFILAVSAVAAGSGAAKAATFEANSRQENGINLGLGDSFLGLYKIPTPGEIHHFCVGVDGYDIDDAAARLRGRGIEPFVRQDRPEIYFDDPDGVRVQLSEKEYRG